jgi:hypothetical protein
MATQNVNIGINVSDNGTAKKVVQSFKEITKAATEAQQAAQGTRVPLGGNTTTGMPAGGTSGSRMVAAKLAPTSSQGMGSEQYGNLRGSAGMTGASARDFANQAQGLGGLVRLYATYAANIFAVSAAFSALSNAMDTANLVKGLDQLGAASGTALGTLSKRLVETTDGAISLREAMESTAKASSSGMSSENILRMGKVAKQAAQALGVDMSDAVNRLTRGITKLEPELLDELGIFTKVDMATQAYAKSVGKSAGAITDFEKRMAFANAVLEEGERKFNAIDFETNPYTKLLASLKNVAQEGLELVNTVLAPIVRFMSESPKALAIAIGALGLALIKQALPALGQFKAGLTAASEEAQALATKKAADAVTAQKQLSSLLLQERDDFANKELQKLDVAAERLNQAGVRKNSAAAKLLDTNFAALSDKDLKQVEKRIESVNKQAKVYTEQAQQASKAGVSPEIVDSLYEKADAYKYAATVAVGSLEAERKYEETSRQTKQANTVATLQANVAESARVSSIKQNIVTNAAYNGSLIGVTGAIKLMNAELQQSGLNLGVFGKSMLFARAGVAAFAGMVTTVMSSIGGFLNIIATVSAAVAFAASFFSTNSKQVQAFGSAITATDDSLLNLGRTLDDIARKPFGEQFNTKSLLATATAITEISTSVSSLVTKILDADKAASGFDRFIDGVKTLWGGDLRSQFGKSISTAVFDSFEKLSDSPQAQKAKASLAAILDVSPEASKQDFESAFKAIADNEPKLRQVERAMKDLGMSFGQTADDAQQFDLATTKSKEAFKGFTDQFKIKDPMSEFALSLIDQSSKTAKALEEPEKAIARLSSIVQDTAQLQLFGTQDQAALMQYGDQIVNVNKNFEAQKSAVKASKEEVKKLEKALDDLRNTDDFGQQASDQDMAGNRAFDQAKKQLDDRREQLSREQNLLQSTQTEVTALTARFPQLAANQLAKGADILYTSIAAGFAKGSSSFADAVLGAVGDLPGLAKQRTDMELRKLQSESQLLKIQASMLQATLANTAQLQKRSAEEAVGIAQSDVRQVGDEASIARLKKAQEELDEINKKISIIQIDPKQALGAIGQVKKEILSGNALIQKDATELFGYLTSLAGNAQQQANNAAEQEAVKFKGILALQAEKTKQELKGLDARKTANNLEIQALDIIKQQDGFLSEQRIGDLQSLQITDAKIAGSEKELAIQQKLDALETAKTKGGAFAPTEEVYLAERALLLAAKKNVQTETDNKLRQINISSTKQVADEQQRQVTLQNELNAIYRQGTDALQATADKQRDIQNETAKSLGTYTPQYQAEQDAQLQATKIRLQAERDAQALTTQFIITSYRLQAEAKQKLDAKAGPEAIKEVEDRLATEAAAYGSKIVAVNSARDAELNALKQIEEQRKKTDDFTNLLDVIKNLDSVWTSFGSSLASTVTIFDALTKSQKQYATTVADLEFERDVETDAKKKLEWQEKVDKTTKDSVKSEISGYGKVAGESKKLFKEKTGAYRTLAAVEKTMHLTRLALEAKELAVKLKALFTGTAAKAGAETADTGLTFAGTIARLPAYAAEIYGKTIGQLGPIAGPAVATALVAAMFAMFGKGSGGSAPFSATSEQLQETQGTGMTFNAKGEKVATGGGILGDDEAKANSVVRSLEILQENSFESLSYDNKLLRSFQGVASAIGKATNVAVTSGLRTIPAELAATLGTSTDKNDTTGIGIVDSLLGSVLGGDYSENRTLQNRRLELRGTFDSVQNDMANGLKLVTDVLVKWEEDGGWLGSDAAGSYIQTMTDSTTTELQRAVIDVMSYFKEGYVEIATQLKKDDPLQFVSDRLKSVALVDSQGQPLKLDLTGLNGADEIRAELEAYFSQVNNIALKALFPEFAAFETAGEDYGTTVIRIIQNTEQVRLGLMSIGMSLNVTGNTAYRVTDVLLEAAGGIDNFVDQLSFFSQKFLSDAERLAPVQAAVSQEMSRLGFSTTTTREQFKLLVQAQDLNTAKGQENYLALMKVAEGFDQVTSSAEETAERLNQSGLTIQQEILSLLGNSAQVLAISRAKTLAETPDELKTLQEYVFTLQDVKTAETNLTKARETEVSRLKQQKSVVESTISSLNNYINSIKKFRESLLLGAQSTLTPSEKYAESKRQFDAILATAMGTATTPEEQRTKDQALSQLEGSASAFLDASRIYNASSSQYTNDFNTVQRALSDTESSLLSQLSIEENSLKQLETQTGLLEDQIAATNAVNNSVISVAQATADLASAIRARDMAFERTVTTGGPADGVGPINLTSTERAIQGYFNQFQNRSVDQSVLQDYSREIAGGTKTLSSIKDEIMSDVSARSTTGAVLVGDMIYGLDDKSIGATQAASNIRNYIANIAAGVATNRNGLENVLADLGMDTDFTAQVMGMNKQSYTQLVEDAVTSGRTAIERTVDSVYRGIQGISPTWQTLAFWTNRISWGLETYDSLIRSVQQEQQNIDALRIIGNATNLSDSGAGGWSSWGGPSFAVGTNFVPDDMLAQVHRGERIIPAADNAELMASIGNRNRTNEVLAQEIKKLNQEIKVLQKAVVDGAVINAQATDRNTVEISKTVKDTGLTASHTEAIRRRTQIV